MSPGFEILDNGTLCFIDVKASIINIHLDLEPLLLLMDGFLLIKNSIVESTAVKKVQVRKIQAQKTAASRKNRNPQVAEGQKKDIKGKANFKFLFGIALLNDDHSLMSSVQRSSH